MEIRDYIESCLNDNTRGLVFKVFDNLHYHDSAISEKRSQPVIQCVLGPIAGKYLPLKNDDIEDLSRVLQILFPLSVKQDLEKALVEFKQKIVGICSEAEGIVTSMEVPVFERITQQALREFSAEDGRFRFTSEPYGIYAIRIYYKTRGLNTFGDELSFTLDDYLLPVVSSTVVSSRETNSLQLLTEKTVVSYPSANAVSYHLQTLVNTNIPPLLAIVGQTLTGGDGTDYPCYEGVLRIHFKKTLYTTIPVICTNTQLVANKGDLATLSFTLARKGD